MAVTSFYMQIWTVSADIKLMSRYTDGEVIDSAVYLLLILDRYSICQFTIITEVEDDVSNHLTHNTTSI